MSKHLDEIRMQYPGQLVLYPDDVARVMGVARQSVYNDFNKGVFPVRPTYNKKRWGCSIIDIAEYLDTKIPQPFVKLEDMKTRRGPKISPRQAAKYHSFWDEVVSIMLKNDQDELNGEITRPLPIYYKPPL